MNFDIVDVCTLFCSTQSARHYGIKASPDPLGRADSFPLITRSAFVWAKAKKPCSFDAVVSRPLH